MDKKYGLIGLINSEDNHLDWDYLKDVKESIENADSEVKISKNDDTEK